MTVRFLFAFIVGLALLAAGLSLGTRIHLLIALIIFAMIAFSLITVLLAAMTCRLRFSRETQQVTRCEPFSFTFIARQYAPMPCGRIVLTLMLPSSDEKKLLLHLPPFRAQRCQQVLNCPHRGTYTVGIVKISLIDVFGFFRVTLPVRNGCFQLEVYPRQLTGQPLPYRPVESGTGQRHCPDESGSPADIRQWQEGDSLKRVHWKLSLRRQELLVRTFEESTSPEALIIPDLNIPFEDKLTLEDLICEHALAQASAQLGLERPVHIHLVGLHPKAITCAHAGDIATLRRSLMQVSFDSPYAFEQVLLQCAGRDTHTGGLVAITANLTAPLADTLIRLSRTGATVRLIFVGCEENFEQNALFGRLTAAGLLTEKVT